MSPAVLVHQFKIGPMENFAYFIGDSEAKEVFLVDPGWEPSKIIGEASRLDVKIVGILCTHCHPDHVSAVETLQQKLQVPVYISKAEHEFYSWNCSQLKTFEDNEYLPIGRLKVKALLTPGHTVGSTSFLMANYLITGDTLFVDACGRTDLPGGNPDTLFQSLLRLTKELDDETIILPGHDYGPQQRASLGEQKQTNPYLLKQTLDKFVAFRMRPRNT